MCNHFRKLQLGIENFKMCKFHLFTLLRWKKAIGVPVIYLTCPAWLILQVSSQTHLHMTSITQMTWEITLTSSLYIQIFCIWLNEFRKGSFRLVKRERPLTSALLALCFQEILFSHKCYVTETDNTCSWSAHLTRTSINAFGLGNK